MTHFPEDDDDGYDAVPLKADTVPARYIAKLMHALGRMNTGDHESPFVRAYEWMIGSDTGPVMLTDDLIGFSDVTPNSNREVMGIACPREGWNVFVEGFICLPHYADSTPRLWVRERRLVEIDDERYAVHFSHDHQQHPDREAAWKVAEPHIVRITTEALLRAA